MFHTSDKFSIFYIAISFVKYLIFYYREEKLKEYTFERSYEFFEKALKYIPNGVPMPRTPYFHQYGSVPVFLEEAKGAHLVDVDGNEYIDYMCAFGAVALGYANPKVKEAYERQDSAANCTPIPSLRWVELAEALVDLIPKMEWVVYGKNGSDVTTYATQVARIHTGKNGIAVMRHGYHGLHHWCIENRSGIPEEYRAHIYKFEFNDLDDLDRVLTEHKGEIAGVFLTPYHHLAMMDQIMPEPGFYEGVRKLCDRDGCLMMMDDVRCGFRIQLEGSHVYFGADVDLVCFGKTLGNGYPISTCMGKPELRAAADQVYFSATHFYSSAPMGAALAVLDIIKNEGPIERMIDLGTRLGQGLEAGAEGAGLRIRYTGFPSMPYMIIEGDDNLERNRFFCGEMAKRGVYMHPHHNWFLSAALSDEDLQKTIDTAEVCFKLTKEKFE